MKNKKEFFGVLISVLVCVFLVYLVVYATTVGSDITVTSGMRIGTSSTADHVTVLDDDTFFVEGDMEVDGTAYFDGTVSLSDSSVLYTTDILGVRDTGLYLRIGDEALTSHSLAADDDLLVNGKLEVDGIAYFDGQVSVSEANGINVGQGNFSFIKTGTGGRGIIMGYDDGDGVMTASGTGAIIIGYSKDDSGSSITASGAGAIAIGYSVSGAITASGTGAIAIGTLTFADGNYSVAMGYSAKAGGNYSLAFGESASASEANSIAMGEDIEVSGANSFGIALNDQGSTELSQANTMAIMGGTVGIQNLAPAVELDVTGDAYFDGTVSVSDGLTVTAGTADFGGTVSVSEANGLLVADGATLMFGPASPTQAVYPCSQGSMFIRTDIASLSLMLNFCDGVGSWTSLASSNISLVEPN